MCTVRGAALFQVAFIAALIPSLASARGMQVSVSTREEPETLQQASRELETARAALLARALRTFASQDDQEIAAAMEVLGNLRGPEAIEALSKKIDFLPRSSELRICRFECDTESYFPAAVALVSIGHPSAAAMRDLLLSAEDPKKRRLAMWVLIQSLGRTQAECETESWKRDVEGLAESSRRRRLYFQTRDELKNFKRLTVPPGTPGSGPWAEGVWVEG